MQDAYTEFLEQDETGPNRYDLEIILSDFKYDILADIEANKKNFRCTAFAEDREEAFATEYELETMFTDTTERIAQLKASEQK